MHKADYTSCFSPESPMINNLKRQVFWLSLNLNAFPLSTVAKVLSCFPEHPFGRQGGFYSYGDSAGFTPASLLIPGLTGNLIRRKCIGLQLILGFIFFVFQVPAKVQMATLLRRKPFVGKASGGSSFNFNNRCRFAKCIVPTLHHYYKAYRLSCLCRKHLNSNEIHHNLTL